MSSVSDARAILDALRFDRPTPPAPKDWDAALDFADRASLTPLLSTLELPPDARVRVDGALARNTARNQRVAAAYREIAPLFDHVLLKGATHAPDFTDDLRHRVQYDLDVYVPRADSERARDAIRRLGYEPVAGWKDVDHLPAMFKAGSPYGATAATGREHRPITDEEKHVAHWQGRRVAQVAAALRSPA